MDLLVYLIDGNGLHTEIVGAGGKAMIEYRDAGTTGQLRVEYVRMGAQRFKKLGGFGTEENNGVNIRHRREMGRTAVVRYQDVGKGVEHQKIAKRCAPGKARNAR